MTTFFALFRLKSTAYNELVKKEAGTSVSTAIIIFSFAVIAYLLFYVLEPWVSVSYFTLSKIP